MTTEQAKHRLVSEMMKLVEQVKKAELPTELAVEIRQACNPVLEGNDTEKILEAFLILAFEMKMYELKDKTDRNAIESLCKLMKLKSAHTFDAIGAAMTINSVMEEVNK